MHGHPAVLSAWGLIALVALQAAKQIQCSLEYTTLKRITQTTEIYYDPDPTVCLFPNLPCRCKSTHSARPYHENVHCEQQS